MSNTLTDKFGRIVTVEGTVGGAIAYTVTDPLNGGTFSMTFVKNGPPWSQVQPRVEAMQPSWYVEPEPEPEPEPEEPAP